MLGTGFMAIIWVVFIADRLVDDDEYREQALNLVDKCSSDCGYNLTPLGGKIQDMVDCLGKQGPFIQAEDICLRRKTTNAIINLSPHSLMRLTSII
ncbi:unnamed protein product [Onchocerca ochengi]|uniref:Saposin B-type domain-containing protein n=1 Tax=Onchocerca ochengi TaxID=42157 RepID=A0A182DXE4_ONCOC|nr:unnamed protein product [Onchocerca ochengi]